MMLFCRAIMISVCFITAFGCVNQNLRSPEKRPVKQEDQQSDYVIVPFWKDTIPVMPSTRYFYRYIRGDFKEGRVTIEWVFGNLDHFGINVNEAWYYGGSSTTDFGNGAVGMTIIPPSLVVGLSDLNVEMVDHHFELMEQFDPLVHPNGPRSRFTHYVRKHPNYR